MLFQVIAVGILLLFYGCYFTKLLRQRKQNIQTDQLGKGKKGFVRWIEISLKCVTYAIVAVEIPCIFQDRNTAPVWIRALGAVLGIAGTGVFLISVLEMRDGWRAGVPERAETALVTTGIYRWSRNPAFLGFDLVYIGIVCMFFSWPLYAVTVLAVLLLHLQIVNVEEPFLAASFGEEYARYRKTVCRYLGRRSGR